MFDKYDVKIDLYSDWVEYLKSQLICLGYNNYQVKNEEDYCRYYFNALLRMVGPVPRKVLFSTGFSCPTEHIPAMETIKTKIEQGSDMTPYLSKNINKFDVYDELLNDWVLIIYIWDKKWKIQVSLNARKICYLFDLMKDMLIFSKCCLMVLGQKKNWLKLFIKTGQI